jgi:hypothetical protein
MAIGACSGIVFMTSSESGSSYFPRSSFFTLFYELERALLMVVELLSLDWYSDIFAEICIVFYQHRRRTYATYREQVLLS